jgi:hypothetical protein
MTPTPADAAWEALAEELRRDYGNVSTRLLLARHRPLIEAALLGDPDAIGHVHVGEWCALCMKHGHDYAALTPPPAEPTLPMSEDIRAGAALASALMAANYPGDSGEDVDRLIHELYERGYSLQPMREPTLDVERLAEALIVAVPGYSRWMDYQGPAMSFHETQSRAEATRTEAYSHAYAIAAAYEGAKP